MRALLALAVLVSTVAPAHAGGSVQGRALVIKNAKVVKGARAWVYLEKLGRRRPPRTVERPPQEIRQSGLKFVPDVLIVPVGTVVAFPNFDMEDHNVFSPTDPPGRFDLGRYKTDKKGKTHRFEDPAEIEIYCDIHQAMSARVKVVDSELIVEVVDGAFVITGVPAGTYRVHGWTPHSDEAIAEVTVTEGKTATPDKELHIQQGPEPSHTRRDGSPYPSGNYQR